MAIKIFLGALVAVLLAGISLGFYTSMHRAAPAPMTSTITNIIVGSTTVPVELATTEAARSQGLSGRVSLPAGSGMLFVFDAPTIPGFWMKDMLFSLDMIFIDEKGKVIAVEKDATPESYHQTPPAVFYPASPVMYVLEVPAGFAAAHGITAGQTATFK